MAEPLVLLDRRDDGVGLLTLHRPDRLNALSSALAVELGSAVAGLAADDAVRAVGVARARKGCCAGAAIAELDPLDGPLGFSVFVRGLTDTLDALAACPKPSVAAIH